MATQETRPGGPIRQGHVLDPSGEIIGLEEVIIPPADTKARSLQRVFVEILAIAGVPWETAFRMSDVAWDVNETLLIKRDEIVDQPPESSNSRPLSELSEEERQAHEERGRKIWAALESDPEFVERMREAKVDLDAGYHYSWELTKMNLDGIIPKLQVVEKSADETQTPPSSI